jgi:hypothetical protein
MAQRRKGKRVRKVRPIQLPNGAIGTYNAWDNAY